MSRLNNDDQAVGTFIIRHSHIGNMEILNKKILTKMPMVVYICINLYILSKPMHVLFLE